MNKILLSIPLLFLSFYSFSQTKKETEDFIKLKLDQLELRVEMNFPNTVNPTTISSDYFTFENNHISIQHNNYATKKISNNFYDKYDIEIDENLSDWVWVELKKIKSIEIKRIPKNEVINYEGIIILKGDDINPYYYRYVGKNRLNKNLSYFIAPKEFKEKPHGIGTITISFLNYNEEIISKLKKAFSHLVKLNGGQIIDDLF